MSPGEPYAGCVASLLTLHGKEEVIAPRFAQVLGLRVETDRGFDTDTLGTFRREVARADLVGCLRCSLRREVPRLEPQLADPGRCAFCNP